MLGISESQADLCRGLRIATACASLALAACGSEGAASQPLDAGTPSFSYPLDDVLRVNQLQAKATHNSYHVETEGNTLVDWHYTQAPLEEQLADQGVRAIELDPRLNYDAGIFEVYHLPVVDEQTTCRVFTDCLSAVKRWSDAHPAHEPIFIQLEPKDLATPETAEAYFGSLEAEILSVWPRDRILAPDRVKGSAATLRDAVVKEGWPTLGQTRGEVLFYFDMGGDMRALYTHGGKDLDGRLAFTDAEPGDPFAAVLILNSPVEDAEAIASAVAANFIVRTMSDGGVSGPLANDTTDREAALAGGAQLISTDFPAPVAETDYVLEIPGGTPSRCNPLTAPPECTSEAIEDPAFF